MFRRMALSGCLLASCIWCLTLVARADNPPGPASDSAFKPAATLVSLMHGQDQQYKAIGDLLADPKARSRTEKLVTAAELLAELGNVNHYHNAKADYSGWADAIRDTALELSREVKKRTAADEGKMKSLHKKLGRTCMACHDAYQ